MYSKIKILGHPIHPMLVAYPIAFYTATLGAYIIYHFSGDAFWFKAAVAANLAGLISAAIAAVPGVLDWWLGIPGTSSAKRHGLIHMLLNLSAIPFVIVNSIIHTDKWDHPSQAGWGIALALIVVLLTIVAGFYGWIMIQDDHVGVREQDQSALASSP